MIEPTNYRGRLDYNEFSSRELEHPDEDWPIQNGFPQCYPEAWMPRVATRHFELDTGSGLDNALVWDMDWPEADPSSYMQTNQYTYYQSYVLVCPGCGTLWCRSQCSNPPDRMWSVRSRWCEQCMPLYIEWQNKCFENRMVNSQHCPGTALSFDDRMIHEGSGHATWVRCLAALPDEIHRREVRLWCLFDALCNP